MTSSSTTRTGYVFDERYMWHDTGNLRGNEWLEPTEHWENTATKRRLHNLVNISGLIDHLHPVKARHATREEIIRFHKPSYHDHIKGLNNSGGDAGELVPFAPGGYEIATLSAGGVLTAIEAVMDGVIDNAYCLVRPPGHHAISDKGMGFCIFNNIAIGALHARTLNKPCGKVQRVAIIDYDVHHGNGTQDAFWNDPDCLFISLHQDNNYPQGSGGVNEVGGELAKGANINIPLPPGSGSGAYRYAFESVVLPALDRFKPDLILVSSGFDASFQDPLASMMLCSEDYRFFATVLREAARRHCGGRIVFAHEGGYSKDYVPFCGLAVIEAISDHRTKVVDHYAEEAKEWGYQKVQAHQAAIIDQAAHVHGFKQHENPAQLEGFTEHEIYLRSSVFHILKDLDPAKREALLKSL